MCFYGETRQNQRLKRHLLWGGCNIFADSAITVEHGWQCVETCEVFASQIPPDINTDILSLTHKCESLRRVLIDAKKSVLFFLFSTITTNPLFLLLLPRSPFLCTVITNMYNM